MELLFVCLAGAVYGAIGRYAMPGRELHGSMLIPAIGTGSAALIWVALTWLGMPWAGGWIWTITLILTPLVVVVSNLVIVHRRREDDALMLDTLSRAV